MNKQEFITHLANQHNCKKVEAEKAIDMFISSVIDAIGQGNEISFVGFGKFYTTKIKARTGRNPRTGQPVEIPTKTLAKFSAGQKLKDACNK
jgi:DNA-binding protein HU-beta